MFALLQIPAGSFNALKDNAEEVIAEERQQTSTEAHELVLVSLVLFLVLFALLGNQGE